MKLSKAFWEGFWFGLNPLNSLRVMRNMAGEFRAWRARRKA